MSIDPSEPSTYDAILIVGFGGPEKPDDVMPFLENVTRGRNIPRERLLEVAEHYYHFGGVSPINGQVRALIAALEPVLAARGIALPIYWGNRNWHPLLTDTLKAMTEARVRRAVGVVLAAYSSYSSCRQYREDVERARAGAGPDAPSVDKVRVFFNHPDFIAANADRARTALESLPEALRSEARFAFTAHSIPVSMARNCRYEEQLQETSRLVAECLGVTPDRWRLVYQSRSGRPSDPWLEPDILDYIADLNGQGAKALVIVPVGFLSDHMEILFDLDEEARQKCDALGMPLARAETVGTHPRFVSMLAELIQERIERPSDFGPRAIGRFPASHDVCPLDCCLPAARPMAPSPG
jgi:protoporphyrin/coproporphyrin ferrochelatase